MTNVGGDTTHTTGTITESGAGSEGTGVAGSLAINIVNGNHTEAVVESGAVANVGSGNVTVKAENNEKDIASATASAKGGDTGVGASVSLNVLLDSITRAEIEDGARLTGGNDLLITADASRTVETAVAAGAKGGTAVTPAVSLVVLKNDRATARLGSTPDAGTQLFAGSATIRATHTADVSKTTAKAESEGETAVGADVAINVILEWSTLAEIARSISASSVSITAQTTMNSGTKAEASASGASSDDEDGDADTKSNKQVSGNDNTKNTGTGTLPTASSGTTEGNDASSSETGSEGGGVGVAAAISVNWVDTQNTARIAGGITVIGRTGAVSVSAQNQTDASAISIGIALNTDSLTSEESSNQIGAAVGLNVALIKNTATIGAGATVTGNGITAEAITPTGQRNDFTVWGMAAAGGKSDVSVAGSIAVQFVDFRTTASVGKGARLTSTGPVSVTATAPLGLQSLALAGAFSEDGNAVGAAIVVNILRDVDTQAFIDSDTTLGGTTHVDATENDLNDAVCSGRMTLAEAQRRESALKHGDG